MGNKNQLIKILLVGADGQLGCELIRTAPAHINLSAYTYKQLDITNQKSVDDLVSSIKPDWVINAAAYTAVDQAESEKDIAYAVNHLAAGYVANAVKNAQARLVHISTDFVFDGCNGSPYQIDDQVNPLCVYGASKHAGDIAVQEVLLDDAIIIRTAWVYSSHGQNFVKTMLRLMSERSELGIVADQTGTPTWANGLAKVIWQAIDKNLHGMYHWTDAGVASWYDFAVAIQEEAVSLGLLDNQHSCVIKPIRTEDYPTPAMRPANSVLDKTILWHELDITPIHWRNALRQMMSELKQ